MTNFIDKNLAKQIVYTVNEVCDRDVNFISPEGIILASTDESRVDSFHEVGKTVADTLEPVEVKNDTDYAGTKKGINMPIFYNQVLVAIVGISGDPEEVRKYVNLAERVTHLFIREREINRHNRVLTEKKHFIMQSLAGEIPYNQDYLKSCLSDLGFELATPKRLVVIQISERYNLQNLSMIEPRIREIFSPITPSIYIYSYPYEYYAIIDNDALERLEKPLQSFAEEYSNLIKIGIGKSTEMFELKKSYESAITALNSIRDAEESFVIYDHLLLDLVLSDINPENGATYIEKTIKSLSSDDCDFLRVYFEENLSLSKTAKKTFLHKNTIQYRLNRIAEQTGYNPRTFTDAVALYLALLMKKKDEKEEPSQDNKTE